MPVPRRLVWSQRTSLSCSACTAEASDTDRRAASSGRPLSSPTWFYRRHENQLFHRRRPMCSGLVPAAARFSESAWCRRCGVGRCVDVRGGTVQHYTSPVNTIRHLPVSYSTTDVTSLTIPPSYLLATGIQASSDHVALKSWGTLFLALPTFLPRYLPLSHPFPLHLPSPPLRSRRLKSSVVGSPALSVSKPQGKSNLVHLSVNIWHLMATILLIFIGGVIIHSICMRSNCVSELLGCCSSTIMPPRLRAFSDLRRQLSSFFLSDFHISNDCNWLFYDMRQLNNDQYKFNCSSYCFECVL